MRVFTWLARRFGWPFPVLRAPSGALLRGPCLLSEGDQPGQPHEVMGGQLKTNSQLRPFCWSSRSADPSAWVAMAAAIRRLRFSTRVQFPDYPRPYKSSVKRGMGVSGTLARTCPSTVPGCSTLTVRLSASVPALGRTRHPFAVTTPGSRHRTYGPPHRRKRM